MRRIVLWVMSTLTMLVLLFSYHTSLGAGLQHRLRPPSSSSTRRRRELVRLVGLVDVGEQRIRLLQHVGVVVGQHQDRRPRPTPATR